MLKLRVATAVVLLLILWFAIWSGPLAFAGVMAICFGLVLYEWLRIGNLGPVPAALIAAIEMISQFSLYWAQALPKITKPAAGYWFCRSSSSCGEQTSALISAAAPGASIRCVRRFRPTRPGKAQSAPT